MSTASTGRPSWVRNSALTVPSRAWASCSTVSDENGTSSARRERSAVGRSVISSYPLAPRAVHAHTWRARKRGCAAASRRALSRSRSIAPTTVAVREHPHRKIPGATASGIVMRVLLTTKRGAGHFGPLIPFARAFRRAGDTVLIAAPHSARASVRAEGFSAWLFDDAPEGERDAALDGMWQLPFEERAPYVFSELFIRLDARAALPAMRDVCRRWRPDLVVSEETEFAGALVAQSLGIPRVCVGIVQQGRGEAVVRDARVMRAIDELRAELGLPDDPDGERLLGAPYFTLMPEALEDPANPVSRSAWRFRDLDAPASGARLDRFAGDERPLVYLTFGSVAPEMDFFPGLYRDAIAAFSDLPVRVLVTVGRDRDPADLRPLPANVQAERWVPQREVMPYAAAMVCHGGSGTGPVGVAAGGPMGGGGPFRRPAP